MSYQYRSYLGSYMLNIIFYWFGINLPWLNLWLDIVKKHPVRFNSSIDQLSSGYWVTFVMAVSCAEGYRRIHAHPEVGVEVETRRAILGNCHAIETAPVLRAASLVWVVHYHTLWTVWFTTMVMWGGACMVSGGWPDTGEWCGVGGWCCSSSAGGVCLSCTVGIVWPVANPFIRIKVQARWTILVNWLPVITLPKLCTVPLIWEVHYNTLWWTYWLTRIIAWGGSSMVWCS